VLESFLKSEGFDPFSTTPSVCCSVDSYDWEVRPVAPVPGCLTMAKFLFDLMSVLSILKFTKLWPTYMDFLCGCTLHEMVWPSSTLTHRTIYDWESRVRLAIRTHKLTASCPRREHATGTGRGTDRVEGSYLAVNLQLLDARHGVCSVGNSCPVVEMRRLVIAVVLSRESESRESQGYA